MKPYQNWLLKSFIIMMGTLIALLSVFWLPDLAKVTAVSNPEFAYLRYPVLVWMLLTTMPFYSALFKSNHLLKLIRTKKAFTPESTLALKHISNCGLFIAIAYVILGVALIIANAVHPGLFIANFILILTSVTISFFANLLKILLEEALQYKNEVDLTI